MQAPHLPSGRYRRTVKGIFFSLSSFMAISSGSDSPFSSTMTGAFMLHDAHAACHVKVLIVLPSGMMKLNPASSGAACVDAPLISGARQQP